MPEALVINDVTYAGDFAGHFITRAVTGADTVQKGCAYVTHGKKKKHTIGRLVFKNFRQRRKATPTSQGDITIDGKPLEPKDLMLYVEFNPRDFEAHWLAEQLSPALLDRSLPFTAETPHTTHPPSCSGGRVIASFS